MDEIRAAIGRAQLRKLAAANAVRRQAAAALREALARIEGLAIPYQKHRGESSHHLFTVLLPVGVDRRTVMAHLKERGIQTSIHYPPLHHFSAVGEYYRQMGGPGELRVAEGIAARILTLPLGPHQRPEVAEIIATQLQAAINSGSKHA
jgi:dTDP-4-amino-4,6-dideoxygalactose transaminase